MTTVASKAIEAENTFSDPVPLSGYFNVSISGTFVATVTVQRSLDKNTWYDVNSFTAPFEGAAMEPESLFYRVGVKTGNYTSGTVNVRLGKDANRVPLT